MGNIKNKGDKKENLLYGVFKEFKNITWPKPEEFKSTSGIVLTFVFLYIVYIGFFDWILKQIFNLLFR